MAAASDVKKYSTFKLEITAGDAKAPPRIPVDVLYDKLVTTDDPSIGGNDGVETEKPGTLTATIRDTVRFELDSKLHGEVILSDVVYPSKMQVEIIGSDGSAKVTRTVDVTAPANQPSNASSATIQLQQSELDAIFSTPEAPKELPKYVSRSAIFVEIFFGKANGKADFTRASLQVAPIKFNTDDKKWENLGFAKLFNHGSRPITTSVLLTKPLPIGIASLPWTSTRVAVDGTFAAQFAQSDKNGYNAFAWLLIGAKEQPILGVVMDETLSNPSSLVLSIILPSAVQQGTDGHEENDTNQPEHPNTGRSDNCGCGDKSSRSKVPAVVSETELANNPGVYTEDPGAFCRPFSNPERILSERTFYSVIRVEQPVISAEATSAIRSPYLSSSSRFSLAQGLRDRVEPIIPAADSGRSADNHPANMVGEHNVPKMLLNRQLRLFDPIFLNRGRWEMSASHPIQWEGESLRYQATTVCRGHILEYRTRTRSNGYSLGGVAKTLTLAPRQTKRIQKIEWSRTERNTRIERQSLSDSTNDSTNKETSYQDAVAATLDEWSQGSSKSGVTSAAAGGGMALGPVVIGGGVASSSSHSESQQSGGRDTTASEESRWRDAVRRHGDALRKFESTVVQEVSQSETVTGSVEVIRNINYAHSLTVIYHNILRHLQVDVEFAGVRECLFVPFAMQRFTVERAYQWRETIGKYLKDQKHARALKYVRDIKNNWANSTIPPGRRCDHPIKSLYGSVFIQLGIARPENSTEDKLDLTKWVMLHPFLPSPVVDIWSSLSVYVTEAREAVFQQKYAPTIAQKWCNALELRDSNGKLPADFTMATTYRFGNVIRIDFQIDTTLSANPITRATLASVTLSTINPLPPGSVANATSVSFSYQTDYESSQITLNQGLNDLVRPGDGSIDPSGANMSKPTNSYEQQDLRSEIAAAMDDCIDHLNENMEYYHKAIWWNMDRDRLFMMLDGFYVPRTDTQVSLASVVEREPIAIAGNSLVYRVAAGAFIGFPDKGIDSPDKLFNWYNTRKTVSEPMHISLPTDGLYAQTIMDECGALEEHYGNHDWALNDPDPELGFLDPALLATRKSEPSGTGPTTLPGTIINLQNAQPAPAPQGVAGALQAVQNANAFRDMAGLAGTQALAKAGLDTAASLATSFGGAATSVRLAEIASKQQATADADKKLASVQRAKDKGLVSQEEGAKQASQILQDMSGPATVAGPHEDAAIQEAIRAAKETPGSTLEATTPAGHVMLGFGITDQLLGGPKVDGGVPKALPPGQRPAYKVLKEAHWGWDRFEDSARVRQRIGGQVTEPWIGRNSCTVRMSRGLNYSGVPIPFKQKWKVKRKFRSIDETIDYMITVKGGDNLNYAIRSREMIDWLRGEWGEPDYEYPAGVNGQPGKDRKPGEEYKPETSVFWGKKGVIAYVLPEVKPTSANPDRTPSSGHIDVWDGEWDTRGGRDLWTDFIHMYLWELK